MTEDRFAKISKDYEALFTEVFDVQGLDYAKFEHSLYETVINSDIDDVQERVLLDVGCGDGATLAPFVNAEFKNLIGVDINEEMLDKARSRFGSVAKIINVNAKNIADELFGQNISIVVTAACIHNIPKVERTIFYEQLKKLKPDLFVVAEKISDNDRNKYKQYYDSEVNALVEVFEKRHGQPELAQYWLEHYKEDEREEMTLAELESALGEEYDLSVVFELGMYKTVKAVRRYN